jgi:hypothetical protein
VNFKLAEGEETDFNLLSKAMHIPALFWNRIKEIKELQDWQSIESVVENLKISNSMIHLK